VILFFCVPLWLAAIIIHVAFSLFVPPAMKRPATYSFAHFLSLLVSIHHLWNSCTHLIQIWFMDMDLNQIRTWPAHSYDKPTHAIWALYIYPNKGQRAETWKFSFFSKFKRDFSSHSLSLQRLDTFNSNLIYEYIRIMQVKWFDDFGQSYPFWRNFQFLFGFIYNVQIACVDMS
jgi:hypothetical protein